LETSNLTKGIGVGHLRNSVHIAKVMLSNCSDVAVISTLKATRKFQIIKGLEISATKNKWLLNPQRTFDN
jgi:hypothetical protein